MFGQLSSPHTHAVTQVLQVVKEAKAKGFSDVLFLDAVEHKYVEEVSSCNAFIVKVILYGSVTLSILQFSTNMCVHPALLYFEHPYSYLYLYRVMWSQLHLHSELFFLELQGKVSLNLLVIWVTRWVLLILNLKSWRKQKNIFNMVNLIMFVGTQHGKLSYSTCKTHNKFNSNFTCSLNTCLIPISINIVLFKANEISVQGLL